MKKRAASAEAVQRQLAYEQAVAEAKGDPGPRGEVGPMPEHEWKGTKLRFQTPEGWGEWVDLRGKQGKAGKDGGSGTVLVKGGGAGGSLTSTPADGIANGDEMLILRDGQFVRVRVALSGTPDNAVTVNGEYLMVNGQYVTVSN